MKNAFLLLTLVAILENVQALDCKKDVDCNNYPNKVCSKGKQCVCKPNYIEKDGKCKLAFGTKCQKKSDCGGHSLECRKKKCDCPLTYYISTNREYCKRFGKHLNDVCVETYGCKRVPNSKCSEDKKCICKSHYVAKGGKCKPAIGGRCRKDSDCNVVNSICASKTCACSNGFTQSVDFLTCEKPDPQLSEAPHQSGEESKHLEPPVCTPETCIDFIGASCVTDKECGIENSICKAKTCQCKDGHSYSESLKKCEKKNHSQ